MFTKYCYFDNDYIYVAINILETDNTSLHAKIVGVLNMFLEYENGILFCLKILPVADSIQSKYLAMMSLL